MGRVGRRLANRWTVFVDRHGRFGHARHDDPDVLIAWTLEELDAVDPDAARQFEKSR